MELTNTFCVAEPVDRAWAVITDLERVAPCVPGATLVGVDGDDYRGAVEVRVGLVAVEYEGVARFAGRDDDRHRAVLRAEGEDVRGQGNVAATVDLRLTARGDGTEVVVVTDLELTGRVAQLGRGVLADVGGKLIGQFARRLEEEMGRGSRPADTPPRSSDDIAPLDAAATGGGAVFGRLEQPAVPIVAAALGLIVGVLLGRIRRPAPRTPERS